MKYDIGSHVQDKTEPALVVSWLSLGSIKPSADAKGERLKPHFCEKRGQAGLVRLPRFCFC